METREPLMVEETTPEVSERYGNPAVLGVGEPAKSALFVPLVTGGKATGVISLQNVDRDARVHRLRPAAADDARRAV